VRRVSQDDNVGLGSRTAAGGPGTTVVAVLDAPDVARGAVIRLAGDGMLVQLPGSTARPLVSHESRHSEALARAAASSSVSSF
jgi:hypothetical protein